jgi:hypothetical protein
MFQSTQNVKFYKNLNKSKLEYKIMRTRNLCRSVKRCMYLLLESVIIIHH